MSLSLSTRSAFFTSSVAMFFILILLREVKAVSVAEKQEDSNIRITMLIICGAKERSSLQSIF